MRLRAAVSHHRIPHEYVTIACYHEPFSESDLPCITKVAGPVVTSGNPLVCRWLDGKAEAKCCMSTAQIWMPAGTAYWKTQQKKLGEWPECMARSQVGIDSEARAGQGSAYMRWEDSLSWHR